MTKQSLYTFIFLCYSLLSLAQMSDIDTKTFSACEDSLLKILPRVCFSKKESNRFKQTKIYCLIGTPYYKTRNPCNTTLIV